jgi:hypothetical protein
MNRNLTLFVCFTILTLSASLSVQVNAAENLLVNGDFAEGTGNQPADWRSETWISLDTTTFTWIPPFGGTPGEVEISNDKLNDARWVQSATLSPGLYAASAEIFTHGVPEQSWAGAFISLGDQAVASLDVKGNSNWITRDVFFRVTREHTRVDVKLRLGGLLNFALGQAFFRNASLLKIDHAPQDALILDLDADRRLWAGNPWSLLPLWLLPAAAFFIGWRMLYIQSESDNHFP